MFALVRKAWAHFRTHGGLATVDHAAARLDEACRARWFHLSERYNDWRLGIRTTGNVPLSELREAAAVPGAPYYEPTDYRSLRRALRKLTIRSGRDVFLDYGSGKGRAVIVTAMYPFRRVIGVEISEELNRAARENVERARRKLVCRDVQLVTANAAAFDVPLDVTCIYMYNPFEDPVLSEVMGKIHQSLQRRPRKITIVYKNPKMGLAKFDWLTECWQFPCYHGNGVVAAFEST